MGKLMLNRLVGMNTYKNGDANTVAGTFVPQAILDYKEWISYVPKGNILSYLRHGMSVPLASAQGTGGLAMDQLSYKY